MLQQVSMFLSALVFPFVFTFLSGFAYGCWVTSRMLMRLQARENHVDFGNWDETDG